MDPRRSWRLCIRDGTGRPAINTGLSVTGLYRIPNVETEVIGVYTNRTPTGPYRGAGHPEATFLIERMVDDLARELARDPVDIRRLYSDPSSATPYRLPTGLSLDFPAITRPAWTQRWRSPVIPSCASGKGSCANRAVTLASALQPLLRVLGGHTR